MTGRFMRSGCKTLVSVTLLGLLAVRAGAAAPTDAEECSAITDDRERLACYDAVFGKPAGAGQQAIPAAAAAAAPAAAPANPDVEFGLSESAKAAREPEKAKQRFPDSISGSVAAVGFKPTGELVVTLSNGQVWIQTDTVSFARVQAGDTVTIRKGALGSYMLVTAGNVTTHVKRLQ